MSLVMFAFGALLIALLVWLVGGFRNQPTPARGEHRLAIDRAQVVLAERFARGELDGEEFTHWRTLLKTTGGLPGPAGGK